MMGVTHIAIGVSFGVFIGTTTGLSPTAAEWTCLLAGSLAPDIDSGNSLISRPGSLFHKFLPKTLKAALDALGTAVSKLFRAVFGHRNAIHWPALGVLFIAAGHYYELLPLIWFGWGYLLHIFADSCTKAGAPILGPFSRRSISWLPLRTGSWQERFLAVCLWVYVGYAGYVLLPADTQNWLERYRRLVVHGVSDELRRELYTAPLAAERDQ